MSQHQKILVKRFWSNTWALIKGSGVLAGCCVAIIIIAVGRYFLSVTTSTLAGWSALFFLSLFTAIAVANLRSTTPFAGTAQMLGLMAGCLTSLSSLFLLQSQYGSLSDVLLAISGILLFPSILSIRPRNAVKEHGPDQFLVIWILRLDDLMKYELPQELKTRLSGLINTLWHSPPDQSDFIPAQNQVFESGISALENSVRTRKFTQSIEIVEKLSRCLEERNQIMQRLVSVHYTETTSPLLLADSRHQPTLTKMPSNEGRPD